MDGPGSCGSRGGGWPARRWSWTNLPGEVERLATVSGHGSTGAPACPGARPGAHFATRADTFRAVMAWNDKRIGDLSMAWSLLHHRHAMGPLRPHSTPGTHEPDTLRARLHRLEQENARLLERERTRLEETRALAGIGRLLSERVEPDVVGLRIAESLRSLLAGGSAVVYRLDAESQSLQALAVAHASDLADGWRPVRELG